MLTVEPCKYPVETEYGKLCKSLAFVKLFVVLTKKSRRVAIPEAGIVPFKVKLGTAVVGSGLVTVGITNEPKKVGSGILVLGAGVN